MRETLVMGMVLPWQSPVCVCECVADIVGLSVESVISVSDQC